jgi:hypothetical protein
LLAAALLVPAHHLLLHHAGYTRWSVASIHRTQCITLASAAHQLSQQAAAGLLLQHSKHSNAQQQLQPPAAMGDTGPFALNEKVLVPHTDKFYEAKVLKAQKREDGLWYYLLHYTGAFVCWVSCKRLSIDYEHSPCQRRECAACMEPRLHMVSTMQGLHVPA